MNFGALNKCTENPVYQLFLYFLFWTCMSEIKSCLSFSFNWEMSKTIFVLQTFRNFVLNQVIVTPFFTRLYVQSTLISSTQPEIIQQKVKLFADHVYNIEMPAAMICNQLKLDSQSETAKPPWKLMECSLAQDKLLVTSCKSVRSEWYPDPDRCPNHPQNLMDCFFVRDIIRDNWLLHSYYDNFK